MSAVPARPAPLRPARAPAAAAVALGAAGAVLAALAPPSAWDVVSAAGAASLVWLAAIDLEARLVPNRIVVPATAVVLALAALLDPARAAEHALAALAVGAFFLLAAAARPGSLGMGDVKLAALLGALLGGAVLSALVIGFALLGLVAVGLLVRDGREALGRQLPLVPFLALGAVATLLVG